jgi:hypothetical protein
MAARIGGPAELVGSPASLLYSCFLSHRLILTFGASFREKIQQCLSLRHQPQGEVGETTPQGH